MIIPVKNATKNDWNNNTFWKYPWGKSVVHQGIDIYKNKGTNVIASTNGIVVYAGNNNLGGNHIYILGAKWRLHYYAHLDTNYTILGDLVSKADIIGTVGNTGNATGKSPHLHYAIMSLFPIFWRWDSSIKG